MFYLPIIWVFLAVLTEIYILFGVPYQDRGKFCMNMKTARNEVIWRKAFHFYQAQTIWGRINQYFSKLNQFKSYQVRYWLLLTFPQNPSTKDLFIWSHNFRPKIFINMQQFTTGSRLVLAPHSKLSFSIAVVQIWAEQSRARICLCTQLGNSVLISQVFLMSASLGAAKGGKTERLSSSWHLQHPELRARERARVYRSRCIHFQPFQVRLSTLPWEPIWSVLLLLLFWVKERELKW